MARNPSDAGLRVDVCGDGTRPDARDASAMPQKEFCRKSKFYSSNRARLCKRLESLGQFCPSGNMWKWVAGVIGAPARVVAEAGLV